MVLNGGLSLMFRIIEKEKKRMLGFTVEVQISICYIKSFLASGCFITKMDSHLGKNILSDD